MTEVKKRGMIQTARQIVEITGAQTLREKQMSWYNSTSPCGGILLNTVTVDYIAKDVKNGIDIGEAIAKEKSRAIFRGASKILKQSVNINAYTEEEKNFQRFLADTGGLKLVTLCRVEIEIYNRQTLRFVVRFFTR